MFIFNIIENDNLDLLIFKSITSIYESDHNVLEYFLEYCRELAGKSNYDPMLEEELSTLTFPYFAQAVYEMSNQTPIVESVLEDDSEEAHKLFESIRDKYGVARMYESTKFGVKAAKDFINKHKKGLAVGAAGLAAAGLAATPWGQEHLKSAWKGAKKLFNRDTIDHEKDISNLKTAAKQSLKHQAFNKPEVEPGAGIFTKTTKGLTRIPKGFNTYNRTVL